MGEARLPLLTLPFWGLNQAERAGRIDLAARAQVGVGLMLGMLRLHRAAGHYVRAAVTDAERSDDPATLGWVCMAAGAHWVGVGNWAAADAATAQGMEVGARLRLHRTLDQVILVGAVARHLTARDQEAATMAAAGAASGRERHDPFPQLWGLLPQAAATLRAPASTAAALTASTLARCAAVPAGHAGRGSSPAVPAGQGIRPERAGGMVKVGDGSGMGDDPAAGT